MKRNTQQIEKLKDERAENEAKIDAARNAYNALSDAQKVQIGGCSSSTRVSV